MCVLWTGMRGGCIGVRGARCRGRGVYIIGNVQCVGGIIW